MFMVVTIGIAFVEPATGESRFIPHLFYSGIAGIAIIFFTALTKKEKNDEKANAKEKS